MFGRKKREEEAQKVMGDFFKEAMEETPEYVEFQQNLELIRRGGRDGLNAFLKIASNTRKNSGQESLVEWMGKGFELLPREDWADLMRGGFNVFLDEWEKRQK